MATPIAYGLILFTMNNYCWPTTASTA